MTDTIARCAECGKALDFRKGPESCNDFNHSGVANK
jgi:hypothetical protein